MAINLSEDHPVQALAGTQKKNPATLKLEKQRLSLIQRILKFNKSERLMRAII